MNEVETDDLIKCPISIHITTRIVYLFIYNKGLDYVKIELIEFHQEMNEVETDDLIKCPISIHITTRIVYI